MSNDTAKTITTNIVPVQGTFEPLPPYECINLIGPAGTPFFAPTNPNLDGVSITNSTINSTTIGVTTPALGAFTTASATNQPLGNNDLTTKLYVDSLALGISWKQPVVAATTANITLSGAQTIDTVAVVAGDRVLVKNQSTQANNGIYIVGTPWTRSPDADLWDELVSALVFVESGAQAGSAWYCPIQPGGTLGVTAITWNNFSVGGVYFAGTGLNLSGGDTFNISNTTVAAASYGSGSAVGTFTVNAQGQLTAAANTNIAIGATQITSGTIDSARLSGSYSGITGVGTLTDLTVSNTIVGSISGNAATATTAGSATTATTATNLAGGAAGSVPYQSGAGATTFLAAGTNGQVLTIAGGVPTYATPTTGTVTSVSGTGTVSGISLSGTVTSSGSLTLGGTLDLSAPPTIGNTTANTIAGTTVTASTSFASPILKATSSAGGTLQNASGAAQMQWGSGGGNNLSLEVATNINPANAAVAISPTGTGTVAISPAGALTINPTTASTMNNVAIGGTTAAAAKVTTLDISSTLALAGSTGTNGYVLTSNGASAPTWQAAAAGLTITDDTTTNATRYLAFTSATSGSITGQNVSSTKLQFNPSTGVLTSTSFAGAGAFSTLSASGVATFSAGTVSDPAITTTGDTNTGIFFPAADTIAFTEGGAESVRITSTGDVGIGTTSPAVALHVQKTTATTNAVTQAFRIDSQSSGTPANGIGVGMQFATETTAGNTEIGATIEAITTDVTATSEDFDLSFKTMAAGATAAERMRVKSTGDFQFNSGYGSVATAYGCRAWVNFDGTNTPSIRASGNVSSITDNGTGDYTVNFTAAISDANYAVVTSSSRASTTAQPSISGPSFNGTYTTSAVQIFNMNDAGSLEDSFRCGVSIFR